jgi:hypothetical protein
MSGPTASSPLDVCGVVVAICIQNAPKRRIQYLSRTAAIARSFKERNLIKRHVEKASMPMENCKEEEHNELSRYPLGGSSSLGSPHQTSPTQLYYVKTLGANNQSHRRRAKRPLSRTAIPATKGISENKSGSMDFQFV